MSLKDVRTSNFVTGELSNKGASSANGRLLILVFVFLGGGTPGVDFLTQFKLN